MPGGPSYCLDSEIWLTTRWPCSSYEEYNTGLRNSDLSSHSENQEGDKRMTLKWILRYEKGKCMDHVRIVSNGRLRYQRRWTFGSHHQTDQSHEEWKWRQLSRNFLKLFPYANSKLEVKKYLMHGQQLLISSNTSTEILYAKRKNQNVSHYVVVNVVTTRTSDTFDFGTIPEL